MFNRSNNPRQHGLGQRLSDVQDNHRIPVAWNLVSFYHCSEDPWCPPGIVLNPQSSHSLPTLGPVAYDFQDYRSVGLPSDCGTVPEDSGYGGSRPTFSAVDTEPSVHENDRCADTEAMEHLIGDLRFDTVPSGPPIQVQVNRNTNYKFYCSECTVYVKTKSELKKHERRHSKPNKCSYSDCPRSKEGFSTHNDLTRHRRTVHNEHMNSGSVYVCIHDSCTTKNLKLWPRADNFRSHLARTHQLYLKADDDLSKYLYRPDEPGSHVLQGVGSSVGEVDPDSRPMQLQDSPILRGKQIPPDTNPSRDVSHERQNVLSNRTDVTHDLLQSPEKGPTLTGNGSQYIQSGVLGGLNIDQFSGHPQLARHQRTPPIENLPEDAEASPKTDDDAPAEAPAEEDVTMEDTPADEDHTNETRSVTFDEELPQSESSSESSKLKENAMSSRASETQQTICNSDDSSASDLFSAVLAEVRSDNNTRLLELLKSLPRDILETALKGGGGETEKATHKCTDCDKVFMRQCELKKHRKRHEKPYGCTFHDCKKSFGSKNDWKRHESSQHFQLETWNCDVADCHSRYSRREEFKNHLLKDHKLEDAQLMDDKLEMCRLGRHCDPRFWCGFCVEIIEIKETNVNAWTKRCDHIDNHLFGKEGLDRKTIAQWRYMEEEFEKVDTRHSEISDQSSSDSPNQTECVPVGSSRKRRLDGDANPRKQKRPNTVETYMWRCCRCSQHFNFKTTTSCLDRDCSHMKCGNCQIEKVVDQDQDIELAGQDTDAP